MPYAKCPTCGEISHLNVTDVAEWYKEKNPGVPVGELVPGKCFYCWQEVVEGDEIIVRGNIGSEAPVEPGTRGKITKIVASPDHGDIYLTHLDSGKERYLIRGELRKRHEDEA